MATLNGLFNQFLGNIEPDEKTTEDAIKAHEPVRDWLANHDTFGGAHVETILAGSYRRRTSVTPIKDVDIVVICEASEYDPRNPRKLLNKLKAALDDNKKYKTRTTPRRRSIQIELERIDLDIVPTVALNGKDRPLLIPDRDVSVWFDTNPKAHVLWTQELNAATKADESDRGRFVPLVKMAKWWRREHLGARRHPKGHMVELIAGYNHDTRARDWADVYIAWVDRTINSLGMYRKLGSLPQFADPGLPGHTIKTGMEVEDFNRFYDQLLKTLPISQRARDLASSDLESSARLWRQIFGDKFPLPDDSRNSAGGPVLPPAPSISKRPDIREAPTFG